MRIYEVVGKQTYFRTEKGSVYIVNDNGTTTRFKAARPEHPGEVGQQPPSQVTFYASPDEINEKLSIFQAEGDGVKRLVSDGNGMYAIKYETGPHKGKYIRPSIITPSTQPKIGLCPVEIFKDGHFVHFGNKITTVN